MGNVFKKARQEKKLTQQQAAEIFNVDRTTVTKWESGQNLPRADMLTLIAKTYECEVSELLKSSA